LEFQAAGKKAARLEKKFDRRCPNGAERFARSVKDKLL
jgi:hypothetical protein